MSNEYYEIQHCSNGDWLNASIQINADGSVTNITFNSLDAAVTHLLELQAECLGAGWDFVPRKWRVRAVLAHDMPKHAGSLAQAPKHQAHITVDSKTMLFVGADESLTDEMLATAPFLIPDRLSVRHFEEVPHDVWSHTIYDWELINGVWYDIDADKYPPTTHMANV
jgi:hypothetical protein